MLITSNRSVGEWVVDPQFLPQGAAPAGHAGELHAGGADPPQRYLDNVIPWGAPDKVGEDILQLREEIGLDYLVCTPLSR